jgi:F0F1-type ATP synthase delta subunit
MKLQLPNSVITQQDVQTLLLGVKDYARWFSHVDIKKLLKVKHRSDSGPDVTPEVMELIHDWAAQKPLSRQTLDELIDALQSFNNNASQLAITLAGPPPASLKRTLVEWCRKNIAPNTLVNFQFNSSLLGGIVIRNGSHVYDWSFRRQILESRNKFPEVLRRV